MLLVLLEGSLQHIEHAFALKKLHFNRRKQHAILRDQLHLIGIQISIADQLVAADLQCAGQLGLGDLCLLRGHRRRIILRLRVSRLLRLSRCIGRFGLNGLFGLHRRYGSSLGGIVHRHLLSRLHRVSGCSRRCGKNLPFHRRLHQRLPLGLYGRCAASCQQTQCQRPQNRHFPNLFHGFLLFSCLSGNPLLY